MSINYKLLSDLAIKKKTHIIELSWDKIAEKCNIIGENRGEKARQISRTKYLKTNNHQQNNFNPTIFNGNLDSNKKSTYIADCGDTFKIVDDEYMVDELNSSKNKNAYNSTTEIKSDGTISDDRLIELSEEDKKTPDILIEKHGFDKDKFELVSARNVMWNVMKSDSDDPRTLYSSRIVVKPRTDNISLDSLKEDFLEFAEKYDKYKPITKIAKYEESDYMLEINVADLHLGKLCDKDITGCDYNTEIASNLLDNMLDSIIEDTKGYKFQKILFVFSNDFFNYDTLHYTTTAGTPQSYDTNWQQLFKDGCHILVNAIEKLSKVAPVETMYIGSNHDKQSAYYLICYLNAWFRNNPDVIIDDSFISRKLVQWGKSLIYFMHGDMPKKQINGIIAREYPKEWGESSFREIHAAHYHSEQSIIENCGAICRYLPSVTGTDVWHYENGYTGALCKTQSFVWSKTQGLKCIINTNAPYNMQ